MGLLKKIFILILMLLLLILQPLSAKSVYKNIEVINLTEVEKTIDQNSEGKI